MHLVTGFSVYGIACCVTHFRVDVYGRLSAVNNGLNVAVCDATEAS